MTITLNENCRALSGYPAELIGVYEPYYLRVRPEGLSRSIIVTPGHIVEEEAVCRQYGLTPPSPSS